MRIILLLFHWRRDELFPLAIPLVQGDNRKLVPFSLRCDLVGSAGIFYRVMVEILLET